MLLLNVKFNKITEMPLDVYIEIILLNTDFFFFGKSLITNAV